MSEQAGFDLPFLGEEESWSAFFDDLSKVGKSIVFSDRVCETIRNYKVAEVLKKLELEPGGKVKDIIKNYLTAMRTDTFFSEMYFDMMRNRPMKNHRGVVSTWTDADTAEYLMELETRYGLGSRSKFKSAFQILQRDRMCNPLLAKIEKQVWDGTPRCEGFLHKWMGCEDTAYNREVSRLIFAGAVNRLVTPGCKFDYVPVFIGKQGCGKSTLCHWLSLDEQFYASVATVEGQKGMEAIQGKFVCELEELSIFSATANRSSEETIKAFITRQDDTYRQPYKAQIEEHPRRCILIGTTNRQSFLNDPTGGRRWLPVAVNGTASHLYGSEEICKSDILQAYAEMRQAIRDCSPLANLIPDVTVQSITTEVQANAAEDDWRIGVIEEFLAGKDIICILELWEKCLGPRSGKRTLTMSDSREIGQILVNHLGWSRGSTRKFDGYGKQKVFLAPKKPATPLALPPHVPSAGAE